MLTITVNHEQQFKELKQEIKIKKQNHQSIRSSRRYLLPVVIFAFPILAPLHSSLVLPIGSYIEPREHPALPPVQ